jgi:hypothetical protein
MLNLDRLAEDYLFNDEKQSYLPYTVLPVGLQLNGAGNAGQA